MDETNGVLPPDESERTKAFNLGSDARYRGDPFTCCPYKGQLGEMWREGWLDMKFWGHWSKVPVKKLPWVPEPY